MSDCGAPAVDFPTEPRSYLSRLHLAYLLVCRACKKRGEIVMAVGWWRESVKIFKLQIELGEVVLEDKTSSYLQPLPPPYRQTLEKAHRREMI